MRVRGQSPGAHAQHDASPGQVVQEHHAIRDHVGVVIGQADDASAQANMAGATCGGGNKHFRRGDSLPAAAVVLADPRFIESQVVQPLDQL